MTVLIVTDSTSDLPPELARELNVSVVPLTVIFGDEVYREGVDIGHDEFYEKLRQSRVLPTTSAPSIGDFLTVYNSLLKETDDILSIHLSSKLSATFNNSRQAAASLRAAARIEVLDSRLITMGMSFVVMAAARAAQAGRDLQEVKQIAESTIDRVRIYFMLDTLEYLRRGGRVGRARAFLGAMLRIKPILSLQEGEVHPEERLRTQSQAIERLFQIVMSYPKAHEIFVGYSTNREAAEALRERVAATSPAQIVGLTRVGPVIGTHCGPGVMGVGLLESE